MKAVILAAGKGTRMRELTASLPKPMLRVKGKPILEHIVDGIVSAGIHQICIVIGWQGNVIQQYFENNPRKDAEVQFAIQHVQDGTGKAPEPARRFVGQDHFLLTYGDILVRPDTYSQMIKRFKDGNFSGVITVTAGEDVSKGAINFFDSDFCLAKIVEKPSPADLDRLKNEGWLKPGTPAWYNAGIYIFPPSLFEFTARLKKSPRGEYELTDAIAEMVAFGHRLAGFVIQGRWVDVRDPIVLAELEKTAL
ncbi:MAG: nucleotidyltransferase family protein [Verrucomicrobiae bacterium]|nr:nucleotidyltransferase family protein [Verrucomicrobiae bacterium]